MSLGPKRSKRPGARALELLHGSTDSLILRELQRGARNLDELALALPAISRELKRNTQRIADTFVQMFLDFIWKPFDDAGRPESDWPQVRAALDQLRPLASEALTAGFGPTMTKAVEVAFGKELERGDGASGERAKRPSRRGARAVPRAKRG